MRRKRFGQHFLEPAWVAKLVTVVAPDPGDTVVEIGPGGGALTLALAPRVGRLVAIEVDRDLADELEPRLPANASILRADVLTLDLAALCSAYGPRPVRVVGNLPYNISSPILFGLLAAHGDGKHISDATVMLQREVAERLAARPGGGDYGVLAVQAGLTADVRLAFELPPGAFRPPPKVHSAVVRMDFHEPRPPVADPARFTSVVRALFTQRRKTILNALKHAAALDGPEARAALDAAGIDPAARPEQVDVATFVRLVAALPAGR
ncbi:MAG: 16S rRNA (adenine(1518)-N(6)/adenine(1519)-N(6))-dimethyltransferase RsmA [Vicinamibacterales bacterium]